jgi:hypothetical protein
MYVQSMYMKCITNLILDLAHKLQHGNLPMYLILAVVIFKQSMNRTWSGVHLSFGPRAGMMMSPTHSVHLWQSYCGSEVERWCVITARLSTTNNSSAWQPSLGE